MASRLATRGQTWCGRCGLERDRLVTRKVERDDGHKLTMRLCGDCDKALGAQEGVTKR